MSIRGATFSMRLSSIAMLQTERSQHLNIELPKHHNIFDGLGYISKDSERFCAYW